MTMPLAEFTLERYFARWEFAVKYILCASDVETMSLDELLALADDDGRRRWAGLRLGYTESLGLPALREEIASLYDGLSADDVITFAGANEGIFLAMHALLAPGDQAVVVWPAYQSLHEVARGLGAEVTLVPLEEKDWSLDVARVEQAMRPNTRVIVINFPHSPTGAQLDRATFDALAALAERHGAHLFSDEVYRFLEHDPATILPAGASRCARGSSLGVMSKAFGLAGLRVGWIATRDPAFRHRLASLKDYTTICTSAPSEILTLVALRARETILTRARAIIADNLAELATFFADNADWCTWVPPRAGSVAFSRLVGDADAFAADLVRDEGVLIVPGSQFGYPGNHFRLGFGRRDMPEALGRFAAFGARRFRG
jgi:aspartate/methionine/tyrosine aminotransferase